MQPTVTRLQEPYRIAPDTWVIPQIVPTGKGEFACINSMVILGAEPVIVDTGCAVNRSQWLQDVSALVDPSDVRWVYLSHGDRDHTGNLDAVLERCPAATLVTTFWGVRYLMADGEPPLGRMRWVNDGESFDAGDRELHAVRPPPVGRHGHPGPLRSHDRRVLGRRLLCLGADRTGRRRC
jgi:glyoxylase-like metal-dependent hydrolase (beta-lactamase superfamily II)